MPSKRFVIGRDAGIKWGRNTASIEQLERLAQHRDWNHVFEDFPHNPPACLILMNIIFDEEERSFLTDRELAQEFWEPVADLGTIRNLPDGETWRGFVQGALSVRNAITAQA